MDFSEKGQEAESHHENVLNLPYSYSKEEQEEDATLALHIVPVSEAFPSPTPQEQEEPTEKDSSSKTKTQKINQLLRQVHEMEILETTIKKNNAALTSRNKLLHKYYLEQRERYIFLKRLNTRYLKDNTRLYRMISLQKLSMKEAKLNPSSYLTLETLAEAAISLQPPEASQATVKPPNTEPAEEES